MYVLNVFWHNINNNRLEKKNSANFGPSRQDGTPVNRMMVTRSWFDVYATTGLGKTKSASKMDCLIQITQLMKENFGISQLGSHNKLPSSTKYINDLPNAIYAAENSTMFPKEQIEKLSVLGYFLDTGNSKSPLEMLYDISNILITRPRVNVAAKNGMHVYKHYVNLYCSTGLGLTVEDAKLRSAEQMLNTLRKLCGFVQMFKLPSMMDHSGNYGNDNRMWLCLPIDDQYKIQLIKYFLESSKLPHTVQLNELAAMLKVVVKYSDTGHNGKLGVACEFGPHVTVGLGATKMISVFRSRSAMLNELKLVCGFVQYPRTFVPLDCMDSTMAENRENSCYGRQQISFPSLLHQGDHPTAEMFPAEPPEYRDTTVSDSAETTATPTVVKIGGMVEIVVRDGVIARGSFNPNLGPGHHYNSPTRPRRSCCVIRVSTAEGLAENSYPEVDMEQ